VKIVHLTSSRFFGGPERQMLELAESLRPAVESIFISFSEGGLCRSFLEETKRYGHDSLELKHDTPHLLAAAADLKDELQRLNPDILLCHGYKAGLLGFWVARRLRIPVAAVSRGWTAESPRVRLYEALDRRVLRWMERVICVSEGQAEKVRAAGVRAEKITVIHNAIRPERFENMKPEYRNKLRSLFSNAPELIVGAAGRLSPEKGFGVLVDAAAEVVCQKQNVGFVLFGDGPLKASLDQQIAALGLQEKIILAGFRPDLDDFLPHFDLFALPSFTEGLPNVVLEAFAAGVPVVATAVGGTPEIVEHGQNGFLVPPGDPTALARSILESFAIGHRGKEMASQGKRRVQEHFSFEQQARQYARLFETLIRPNPSRIAMAGSEQEVGVQSDQPEPVNM
jgi:glycosyltransferase involved in cell wall biosynthesis